MSVLPRDRLLSLLDRAERIVNAYTLKTIAQVTARYRDGLTSLVYEAFNHRMDAIDMRRNMKALIRELAPQAIQEGWREGGLTDNMVEDEDQQWADEGVADWIAQQVAYVNSFAADAYAAGSDKDRRAAIIGRMEMWVDALRDLGELAKAYAMRSEKAVWKLGNRQNHTPDCIKLSQGAPHRLQWFIDRGYTPPLHMGCGCTLRNFKTGDVIMGEE